MVAVFSLVGKDESLIPVVPHAKKVVHWVAARFKKQTPRAWL